MEEKGNFKLQSTPRVPCDDTHRCGGGNIEGNTVRNYVVCDVNRLVRTVFIFNVYWTVHHCHT